MARKSNSGWFTMGLLAVGGYFAYSNWPAISAWFATIVPMPTAGPATASGTYPNSPVPTSYSTNQTFVDSSGNQWQFSTQTGQWVIASPGPAPVSPSPGTVVSTLGPATPAAPVAVVPASPGTVVPTGAPPIAWTQGAQPTPFVEPRLAVQQGFVLSRASPIQQRIQASVIGS